MIFFSFFSLGLLATQAAAFKFRSGDFAPGGPMYRGPLQGNSTGSEGPSRNNPGGRQDLRALLLDPRLAWSADTSITFPDDGESFENVTDRWSTYSAPSYLAAVSPAIEEDVVQAVQLARQNRVDFLATGGRHGYVTGFGRLQNGLAIDLSNFASVEVDEAAATLTVGGGVRARDVTGPVSQAGFELPLGGCSCPGMVGVTIGGGITNWLGVHGLLMDALLSVRLVTADGRIVEASEEANADLFWAIRGAGANFGIILSATYQLFPPTNDNEIVIVETTFAAQQNVSYYEALEVVTRTPVPELSLNAVTVWDETTNSSVILANFHYFGPQEEVIEILGPILDVGPVLYNVHTVPWSEYHHTTLFGFDEENCVPGLIHNPFGAVTINVSVPTLVRSFEIITQLFVDYPSTRTSSVTFHSYTPEAAAAIPADATAYGWRDALHYMYVLLTWTPGEDEEEAAAIAAGSQIRSDFAETSGYGGLAAYMNFAQGDETVEEIYGERNLPRLASLKATWDPENVFRYHFPLPTSYPETIEG
ncbi:hypothetical protein S7711_07065 [Stachybotrys chartarum IBT 7711]|uniref:FAD-binding PCMH-type domain-containing protein n=1 Tax=Stachybotrys chartarum (strain CBS 109288 / IBT 7711) TaxID=1280523 RepID=A0A084AP61_STACB|nr:hypothetical protein S7711_07065 [Stachybotrys chartarum IBT 7711]KFA53895.1 hypothetical protein S40293_08253 [Stachybotrys chartarum IBT 40293]